MDYKTKWIKVRLEVFRQRNYMLAVAVMQRVRELDYLSSSQWARDALDEASQEVFRRHGAPQPEDYVTAGLDIPDD